MCIYAGKIRSLDFKLLDPRTDVNVHYVKHCVNYRISAISKPEKNQCMHCVGGQVLKCARNVCTITYCASHLHELQDYQPIAAFHTRFGVFSFKTYKNLLKNSLLSICLNEFLNVFLSSSSGLARHESLQDIG